LPADTFTAKQATLVTHQITSKKGVLRVKKRKSAQ